MKVTIHGPNLKDQSEGTFRVHEAESTDNAHETKMNGSLHPETIEAQSREDVVDLCYPADEFDREPDDLAMYLADIHFGDSCESLPTTPPNEGEDSMAEATAEQLTMYLETYTRTQSYRATAKELGVSASTAKKLVEKAQSELAATSQRATTPRTRSSAPAVPVVEDATKKVECKHCTARLGKKVSHPATTEFWYVNKSTGALHTSPARCKIAEKLYRDERRAAKAGTAAAAPAPAPVAEKATNGNGKPDLKVVAAA